MELLKRYNTFDLIIIATMAALGLGTKQIIRPVIAPLTVLLIIPAGGLIGGFYMLWLVLTKFISPKFGSGLLFGIVQAFAVLILPFGSHGFFTFITYTVPGLIADIVFILFGKLSKSIFSALTIGALTNTAGTFLVGLLIMGIEPITLLYISLIALISGNIGGIIAFGIYKQIKDPLIQESNINQSIEASKDLPTDETM